MTHIETKLFIKKIKFIFPRFLQNADITSREDMEDYVELWQELLSDLPFEVCAIALKRHVMISKWEPSVSDIREQASKVTDIELNPADSWNKCCKIAISLPHYEKWDIDGLDEIEKKCLLAIGIENIKKSENLGIERSNFMKMFIDLNDKKTIENKMPKQLKSLKQSEQFKKYFTCQGSNPVKFFISSPFNSSFLYFS